jgi:hypothetical protein
VLGWHGWGMGMGMGPSQQSDQTNSVQPQLDQKVPRQGPASTLQGMHWYHSRAQEGCVLLLQD